MVRTLTALAVAGLLLGSMATRSMADDPKELNFGIISTEATQNLKAAWEPLLQDMAKSTGFKVKAFFAPDYAGVIEGMRFKKVDVAWYGNKSGMEAVDRANGEVFAHTTSKNGDPGYWSLLIVPKDSPLNSLDDLLKTPRGTLSFGNGDPNSTSGFLVPSFYVFAKNNIDPKTFFKRVVSANHETNALAVANKQVDVATNNTEDLKRVQRTHPDKYAEIKIIWKSPLIPRDPIVWRKDLPDETKAKIKAFLLAYGRIGANKPAELAVLEKLEMAPFVESNNDQLIGVRQLTLFTQRTKIMNDAQLSDGDKQAQVKEIDAKLKLLNERLDSLAQN
jgi:phosphonate transport system substrate-binding protein